VEAARTDTADDLADLMAGALSRPGPFLIELIV
jgi:thiamine pyrophosphate-dependent acetolactate synthase large subunit-like protein